MPLPDVTGVDVPPGPWAERVIMAGVGFRAGCARCGSRKRRPRRAGTVPARETGQVRAQRGFALIHLVAVLIAAGLIILPLLTMTNASVLASRAQRTEIALKTARDALIAFAAANNGCLPFAADYEGGLPDTDASGLVPPGYRDAGLSVNNRHGRDVPWATLGLTNAFLDGDVLRIQYYVASHYTDEDGNSTNGIACRGGFRGSQWDATVTYIGTTARPLYVYYTPPGSDRSLYKIVGTLPAGTPPDTVDATIAADVSGAFPVSLLEVRRGPDVNGPDGQSDVVSAQNVFVLIAPGVNRNAEQNMAYVRDAYHRRNKPGFLWPLNQIIVDKVVFSNTHDIDVTDRGNDGDDTLLIMSFIQFKAELNKYEMNIEPILDAG